MNFKQHILDFLAKQPHTQSTIDRKEKIVRGFCDHIRDTFNPPADWDFDKAIPKATFGERIIFAPVTTPIVANYMNIVHKANDSAHYYNSVLGTLKEFGRMLVDNRVLLENPAYDLPLKKIRSKNMDAFRLRKEEAIRLLEVADSSDDEHRVRNFNIVLLLLASSTRVGELKVLTEEDLALDYNLLYAMGKSGRRIRLLTDGCVKSLRILLTDPVRLKTLEKSDKKYLFYDEKKCGAIDTRKVNRILKSLAAQANINKDITVYWLRRTYGTLLADAGFNLPELQALYRHDRPGTTEKYLEKNRQRELRKTLNDSTVAQMVQNVMREQLTLLKD